MLEGRVPLTHDIGDAGDVDVRHRADVGLLDGQIRGDEEVLDRQLRFPLLGGDAA